MASDQQSDQLAQLTEENAALRQKLEKYKSLEEDLAAQRVFEKVQKQMKNWITVGGIATLIAGIVGYKVLRQHLSCWFSSNCSGGSPSEALRGRRPSV